MGRPKAWLPFGDELMLPRVIRLLRGVVAPVIVVAAPDQAVPPLPNDIEIVRDPERGRGPLQGLTAGLTALRRQADAAYLSSCDVPFLRPMFVRRLVDLLGSNAICVPDAGGYRHPLAAVYRLEVTPVAEDLLAEDRLRPAFLFEKVQTRFVTASDLVDVDPDLVSLRNLNTPDDYLAALRALADGGGRTRVDLQG
jgi:molybdopterin-guanine dinucleotide biosynthesis protein A